MSKPSANDELFGRYLDGVANEDDIAVLREQLLADSEAVDSLVAVARFETLIRSHLVDTNRSREIESLLNQDTAEPPLTLSPLPTLSTTHYPLSTNFVGGPIFSYMVATVVLCLMLLGAWAYKITRDRNVIANNSRESTTSDPLDQPELVFVGLVTGMKDCQWSDHDTQTVVGASASIGREYALASGLLEITYTGGAKVILEGPCTYKVDSTAGGYLERGKLTARICGQRSAVSGQRPEKTNQKSEIRNQKFPDPWPLTPDPFVVRTPTAVVTDLGTEFGVEVAENGDTTSYVFQGVVKVEIADGGTRKLTAGESVLVEMDETQEARFTHPTSTPKFVRRLHEPPKILDLLDIVAGGDGTGKRRECGIDPSTGKQDTWFLNVKRKSDHKYHRVEWAPLIDGVFIPHVSQWTVPKLPIVHLDSAGSTFDRFQESRLFEGKKNQCSVMGHTTGGIWARSADINSAGATQRNGWIYTLVDDEQYMPERLGLLGLHATMGITFDLAAMREMYDGARPARLRAKLGMGDGPRKYPQVFGVADLWIFVDGRLAWVRKDVRHEDGAIDVDVPLGAESRFLTFVSTNGSRGQAYDWIILGDPVLEMKTINSND